MKMEECRQKGRKVEKKEWRTGGRNEGTKEGRRERK